MMRRAPAIGCLLAGIVAAAPAQVALPQGAGATAQAGVPGDGAAVQAGTSEDGGLRVAWRYEAEAGAPGVGTLEIEVADAATGTPVRYPRGGLGAWMQRQRATLAEAETACADRVATIRNPRVIGRRTDVDVDTSRILTLNADGTLAVINPFVGLNNAKLEAIAELGGTPRAWLQIPERTEAWVALADPARLVAVDLRSARIRRAIDLPSGSGIPLLAWDAAERRLYAAVAGHGGLGVIDPAQPEAPLAVLPGPAATALFADADGALSGVVSLHAGGEVLRWVDGGVRRLWRADPVRDGLPRLVRNSALARRLVVATDRGVLALLDPATQDQGGGTRRIALGQPAQAMELLDDGRRALVLGGGRVSLVDLATGTVALVLPAPATADQLVVTDGYAYAISVAEGQATLWLLADLRRGTAQPIEVTIGPPDPEAAAEDALGPLAVPTAARDGILVAGATEGIVRQYGEGQMAYRGDFSNYRRAALGLGVLDMALREVAPGRYRAPVRHARGGPHVLVLAGGSPRFAACGRIALAGIDAEGGATGSTVRAELVAADASGGSVRVRLRDAAAGGAPVDGVPDLVLMLFNPRSGQSLRRPLREVAGAPGEYEARFEPPRQAAHYDAMVASGSRGLTFDRNAVGAVRIGTAAP